MVAAYGDDAGHQFTAFAGECLNSFFKFMPPSAASLGLHEYDGQTPDLSKESIEARIAELRRAIARLNEIDASAFDVDTRLDYRLLRQGLESELFKWAEQRE